MDNDVNTSDSSRALLQVGSSAVWELIKIFLNPGPVQFLSSLHAVINTYKHSVDKQALEKEVYELQAQYGIDYHHIKKVVTDLEQKYLKLDAEEFLKKYEELAQTEAGDEYLRKLSASLMNAEYTDKVEFFNNALNNGVLNDFKELERLEFVETLRRISKPALVVFNVLSLSTKGNTFDVIPTNAHYSHYVMDRTGYSREFYLACISELESTGLFVSEKTASEKPPPVYGETASRFLSFIQEDKSI